MHSILIAEDDQNTREGLVELLSDEGYDVTGVNDGESAYEIARNSHFEVFGSLAYFSCLKFLF